MKKPLAPEQPSSQPSGHALPPFILLGESASTLINTSEIFSVRRELMEVTDEKRDRYRGFITPQGKAYVLIVNLKDGRRLTYKCVNEEYQDKMFYSVSSMLGTHLIEYPAGMAEAAQKMREGQQ